MRRFFEPTSAPAWLKQTLSSIRQALGDIWDVPVRLWQVATASLPTAADFKSGLVYDETLPALKYSDGTNWIRLSDYDADVAAIAALTTTGLIARTGSGTVATRTITGTANQVSVANGDGVAGNPTLSLPAVLVAPGTAEVGTGEDRFDPTMAATFRSSMSVSGGSSTNHANIFNLTATAATAVGNVALIGVVDHAHAAGTITSTSMSVEGFAIHSGAGNSSSLRGVSGNVFVSGSGTVTAATSIFAAAPHKGGGSGTITTAYGVRVASITEGTTNWAVLTEGTTPSSFGGAVSAASLSLTTPLGVASGGIGVATITGLMQGNGTGAVTGITNSSTVGQVLRTTGASTYAWGALDLADTDAITGDLPFANLAQGSALSVLGVTGNATADNASIAAGSDHQVLRRSGTAVAFGAVDLAQSAAVTGTLPVGNGGTGAATFTNNRVLTGNGTSAIVDEANLTFNGTTLTLTGLFQHTLTDGQIQHESDADRVYIFIRGASGNGAQFLFNEDGVANRGTFGFVGGDGTFYFDLGGTSITAATAEFALSTTVGEFRVPVGLPSYAVASLPATGDGTLAFASNGRKTGEGAGAGTGVPVYRDGGTWFRFADDSAVAA